MIKVYQKIQSLDNPEVFHTWMYILVCNVCYDYLHSIKNTEVLFLQEDDFIDHFSVDKYSIERDVIFAHLADNIIMTQILLSSLLTLFLRIVCKWKL
jgi:DNA-directed RNA polymerase specialized sigma24 family protein